MDSKINIIQTVTGSYMVNTYLVSCPETREGFIVDPGGDLHVVAGVNCAQGQAFLAIGRAKV